MKTKALIMEPLSLPGTGRAWGEINVAKPEFPGSTGFPVNRIHTSLPTSANNGGSCQGTGERNRGKNTSRNAKGAKSGLSSKISGTIFKPLHSCVRSSLPSAAGTPQGILPGSSCEPISSACVTPPGLSNTSQVASGDVLTHLMEIG